MWQIKTPHGIYTLYANGSFTRVSGGYECTMVYPPFSNITHAVLHYSPHSNTIWLNTSVGQGTGSMRCYSFSIEHNVWWSRDPISMHEDLCAEQIIEGMLLG